MEGRWGWLAGPMALLTWVRTRRERREAAEAMQAFQGLVEAFLTMLEDFRAGRLPECARLEADAEGGVSTVAHPPPQPSPSGPIALCAMGARSRGEGEGCEDAAPLRLSASSAVNRLDRGARRGTRRARGAGANVAQQGAQVVAPPQWIPAFAGMTGTVSLAGFRRATAAGMADFAGSSRRSAPWARPPPRGIFQECRRRRCTGASILLRYRNNIIPVPAIPPPTPPGSPARAPPGGRPFRSPRTASRRTRSGRPSAAPGAAAPAAGRPACDSCPPPAGRAAPAASFSSSTGIMPSSNSTASSAAAPAARWHGLRRDSGSPTIASSTSAAVTTPSKLPYSSSTSASPSGSVFSRSSASSAVTVSGMTIGWRSAAAIESSLPSRMRSSRSFACTTPTTLSTEPSHTTKRECGAAFSSRRCRAAGRCGRSRRSRCAAS